jgi:hypothetical protein
MADGADDMVNMMSDPDFSQRLPPGAQDARFLKRWVLERGEDNEPSRSKFVSELAERGLDIHQLVAACLALDAAYEFAKQATAKFIYED